MFTYVDTETTGLDARIHDVTEVAWAKDDEQVTSWVLPHTLDLADKKALEISRYFERQLFRPTAPDEWKPLLAHALTDEVIVGANTSFDAEMLKHKIGYGGWHHRLLDIEGYGAGVLGWKPGKLPSLRDLADTLRKNGWPVHDYTHAAADDVECCRDVHVALLEIAAANQPQNLAPAAVA